MRALIHFVTLCLVFQYIQRACMPTKPLPGKIPKKGLPLWLKEQKKDYQVGLIYKVSCDTRRDKIGKKL